jgi:hypothetical protein
MRTLLALVLMLTLTAVDASAQRRGPRGEPDRLDLRECAPTDALCVADLLIRHIAAASENRVRHGVLIARMYSECSRPEDARCPADFIMRAVEQSQSSRAGPETERFRITARECAGGQCRLDQKTADFLCQQRGYDFAQSADPAPRRSNPRECNWNGHWGCDDNCRSCGNGIEWVTCGR